MTELFRLARPAVDARETIARQFERAAPALLTALAGHGHDGLRSLGWPPRDLRARMEPGQVWGVPVSEIVERPPMRRDLEARAVAPGSAGPAAVRAAVEFETLAELLLETAPRELKLRRLGEALSVTTRQVHALEERFQPRLEAGIARVRRTLEEREREEHLRLKHVRERRLSRRRASTP